MLTNEFNIGSFTVRPSGRMQVAGEQHQLFDIAYGSDTMRERIPVKTGTQNQVAAQLNEAMSDIIKALRAENECRYLIELVNARGERLAAFKAGSSVVSGMTAGLIDDRFDYWLRSEDQLYSMPVTLNEYAALRAEHNLPCHAWIADLLPADVLTTGPEDWRPPTHWELRHIIGEGSLTGITGAKASAMVGVNPSSFRKYTASEGAKNRQQMSFAMWHLLLHRLEIKRLPENWA